MGFGLVDSSKDQYGIAWQPAFSRPSPPFFTDPKFVHRSLDRLLEICSPLCLFISTLVGGFRTLSSSRKEIREGALFEKEEVFRVPFFPRTRTKHRSISFRKAGEEKNYIDIVLLSLISFFYFQRRAAVPASKKLGTLKYLDAAFGSALELERAQTR